jgi:cation transport regulator ChaB
MKKVSQKQQIETLKAALKVVAAHTGPTSPSTNKFMDLAKHTLVNYDKLRLPPKKPKKDNMIRIRANGLGEYLHSALRKACDSSPTTIAWNIICMEAFNKVWEEYLDLAEKQLVNATPKTAWKSLKAAGEQIGFGTYAQSALKHTFAMFDDNDWQGMASYLEEI